MPIRIGEGAGEAAMGVSALGNPGFSCWELCP